MRIPSGSTDRYVYFVAVDDTDGVTRETGLSSFTVYRSRNGGAAAAMTTPTINETDATNMPGVYELLLDEDTTLDAAHDSEEMVYHITHAGMRAVTKEIEIYRPGAHYSGGKVYVDSGGATGTANGVGTASIPSTTLTSALTIAGNNDIKTIHVQPNNTVALVSGVANHVLEGKGWTCQLGTSIAMGGTIIRGATVSSGTTPTGTGARFEDVVFTGTVDVPNGCDVFGALVTGTAKLTGTENHAWTDIVGDGGTINFDSQAIATFRLHMRGGTINLTNCPAATNINIFGNGDVIVSGNTGCIINIYGNIRIQDSSGMIIQHPSYLAPPVLSAIDVGDWAEDSTVRFAFTSSINGNLYELASGSSLRVYKNGDTTESSAGITLTRNFDGVTGLNLVTIDTSADAFYAAGADYCIKVNLGTVSGKSVAGMLVGWFSIENRAAGDTSAIATAVAAAVLPEQNVAFSNIKFLLVSSTDHATPVTGATVSVQRSIDGGAFGSGTGTVAEIANGIYQYDASQGDMNGGKIMFRFSATGADDAFLAIVTNAGV